MKKLNIIAFDGQITKNFNIEEFKCRANGEVLINKNFIDHVDRLQVFREWYNRPMVINSGYRTVNYNKRVGGSPKSKHIEGIATDFKLPQEFYNFDDKRKKVFLENVKNKWYEICENDNLGGGVGWYDTFIHLDSRSGRKAFWDNRK